MKIIFDIDGTMTDYHAYIETYALPWFYKRYGLRPIKPDRLELEDILDLQAMLQMRHGCTPSQAERKARKLLDRYWISHRSIHYLLLTRFRPGCRAAVKRAKELGAQTWIYTSRAHTARRDLIGGCARLFTMGQLWLNGVWVKPSRIRFFQDDQEKLEGILRAEPQLVFDDKVEILDALRQRNIPAVCVAGPYNTEIHSGDGMERITEYSAARMEELLKKVKGKKAADQLRIARADRFWKRIVWLMPLVRWYLDPVVLHADRRIRTKDAVLYAPNHRSTLDPLAILSVVEENIHWAALLRFFQAKDSIFNNSKNPFYADSPHGRSVSWPTFRSIVRPMIQTQITWPPSGIWRAFWGCPRRSVSSERVRPDARRAGTLGCSTGRSPSWPKGPVPGYSRSRSAGERPRKKESSPSSILGRRLRSAIRMSDPLWKPSCRSRERG